MIIKLTPFHWEELIKKGYGLDCIFLLKLIHEQFDISSLLKESAKIAALNQSLQRKSLINDAGDKLTTLGQELLVFIDTKISGKIVKKKLDNTDFDIFWKEFPGLDTFTYKGKTFTGCRSLKQDKEACRIKFDKIMLGGEYSAIQLIEALKFDVNSKKEQSLKTGTNKLTYMQNSLTYLNQCSYINFIELIEKGTKIYEVKTSTINGTDI